MLRNQIISLRSGKTKIKMKVKQTKRSKTWLQIQKVIVVALYYVGVDLNGIIGLLGTGTTPFWRSTSLHLTGQHIDDVFPYLDD